MGKIYISPEIKISLLSKDCLIRLRVIDPSQFLTDAEVSSFSVNTVDERKDKLSDCEKSFSLKKMAQLVANAPDGKHLSRLKRNSLNQLSEDFQNRKETYPRTVQIF